MTRRLSQWFTIILPISAQGMANAVYNGEYNGVQDPIGEGKVDWGAEPDINYYVLKIVKILEIKNNDN